MPASATGRQGTRHLVTPRSCRLCAAPQTWRDGFCLRPRRQASSQPWRATQHSRRPLVAEADAGDRSVRPDNAEQKPPAQQQQQHSSWLQTCEQVAAFQQQHGRLPRARADAQGPLLPGERPLGLWCTEQLRRKAGSKGLPLSAEERRALEAISGWG